MNKNIYEEYAKYKTQIDLLNSKLKEIEPLILKEIEGLSAPMKTEHGTFTTSTRTYWKLSEDAQAKQKEYKEKIKEVEAEDIKNGNAEMTQSTGVRFIKNKK